MKTKIIKIKGDWVEVLNDCRFTVNKANLTKEPSEKFKKKILIAEHSPIRDISIKWKWTEIPHWIVVHWVRHKWEKFVATQRTDRTGIDRNKISQNAPSNMIGEANIQHLIDTYRKRLCFQASKETREYAEDFKVTTRIEVDEHIANVLVPNCIYRGGCPEFDGTETQRCRFYENFVKKYGQIGNIQERYDNYNKDFYLTHEYRQEEENESN